MDLNPKLQEWIKTEYPLMQNIEDAQELDVYDFNKFANWLCGQIEPLVMPKIAVKELMCKSKTINKMFKKDFWDAHYIDVGIRLDGKTITEEADWIKELWYLVKDSNFSE